LDKKNENERRDKKEKNISFLLAMHADKIITKKNGKDVSVLVKESVAKKRKIHEAQQYTYIGESQPSNEIPLLLCSILKEDKTEIIRERKSRREEKIKEHTGNREERQRGREGTVSKKGEGKKCFT
jgi:hypothetical protein